MNIYQMYVGLSKQVGFWVVHTAGGGFIARVTSIGPLVGPGPYYGNPVVRAEMFRVKTGEIVNLDVELPNPGMSSHWRLSNPPRWWVDLQD
jgi:hypothetical protein